jgi:putative transposase
MGHGIEGSDIFKSKNDRVDFLERFASLCEKECLIAYAWALMPNHFHLLVRTGGQSLSVSMKRLLTGYVINFNRRHRRRGYLFQNRYKSIVCEDDPYLLELTRYIHLNPVRAGLVEDMKELRKYPWTGHSALMGTIQREWQDTDTVLAYFGSRLKQARDRYQEFVEAGIAQGRREDLVGGGLVRSAGGWFQVLSFRRKGIRVASDERILGSGEFVQRLLSEVDDREKETLRLSSLIRDLPSLASRIAEGEGVTEEELRSGGRTRRISKARRVFCQVALKKMGHSGAEVARFLGVTTSAVFRAAGHKESSDLRKYL